MTIKIFNIYILELDQQIALLKKKEVELSRKQEIAFKEIAETALVSLKKFDITTASIGETLNMKLKSLPVDTDKARKASFEAVKEYINKLIETGTELVNTYLGCTDKHNLVLQKDNCFYDYSMAINQKYDVVEAYATAIKQKKDAVESYVLIHSVTKSKYIPLFEEATAKFNVIVKYTTELNQKAMVLNKVTEEGLKQLAVLEEFENTNSNIVKKINENLRGLKEEYNFARKKVIAETYVQDVGANVIKYTFTRTQYFSTYNTLLDQKNVLLAEYNAILTQKMAALEEYDATLEHLLSAIQDTRFD